MYMYFQVEDFFFFYIIGHSFIHFLELSVDLFQLVVNSSLTNVAIIKFSDIMRCHLKPVFIIVNGYILLAELPNCLIGQYVTIAVNDNTFIRMLQRFFKIFGNLKLTPAQCKRQMTHTVIAKDNTPVRVGIAQTHRQLVCGIFNGKWGEHVLSATILSRQSKGKMNNTK